MNAPHLSDKYLKSRTSIVNHDMLAALVAIE